VSAATVGAAQARFIYGQKRFSTAPRAARSRLATADLKRVTSARSPLGNAGGSALGNAFPLIATACLFFEVVGPIAPGPKPPVDWHDLKHHAAIENFPRSFHRPGFSQWPLGDEIHLRELVLSRLPPCNSPQPDFSAEHHLNSYGFASSTANMRNARSRSCRSEV
jgi:hypothetical protein